MIWLCSAAIVVTVILLAASHYRHEVERCEAWRGEIARRGRLRDILKPQRCECGDPRC